MKKQKPILKRVGKPGSWTSYALCRSDARFVSYNPVDVQEAKEICSSCTVRRDCIISTKDGQSFFMAAGTTRFDRLLLSRREVDSLDERVIGDPEIAISEILRRER